MVSEDRAGLPVAVGIASTSPYELMIVEATLDDGVTLAAVEVLIGDAAHSSDGVDFQRERERGMTLDAPHQRVRRHRSHYGRQ